jgi:hypothetical protein
MKKLLLTLSLMLLLASPLIAAEESCNKVVKVQMVKDGPGNYAFFDYKGNYLSDSDTVRFTFSNPGSKPIKITSVALKTKDKQIITEQNENAIIAPFTKNLHIGIPKRNLMLELAAYGTYSCNFTNELPVQKKTEAYQDNQNNYNSNDNSYYKSKSHSKNKKNYSSNRNYNYDAGNNYSKPKAEKDPIITFIMWLGVIATIVVGIYTRSFLMGLGVMSSAISLAAVLTSGPAIILIWTIPATIGLFYFGNKEIENRKKK